MSSFKLILGATAEMFSCSRTEITWVYVERWSWDQNRKYLVPHTRKMKMISQESSHVGLLWRQEFCTDYCTSLALSRKNAEVCEMRTVKLLCIGRRDKFQIEPWKGNMKGLSNKSRLKVGIKSPTAFVTFYSYISECDSWQNSAHGPHISVTVV